MSNLFILLKSSFINNIGINSLSKGTSGTKEKKKLLFAMATLIFIGVLICFMSTTYSIGMATVLKPMGYLDLVLIIAILASSILSFGTSIYKAQGTLFSAKDYDLLMSLPIKNSTILSSKIISMMGINYIGTAFVLIPASVVYFIYNGSLSWMYFLVLIIGLIFIPMIPIILASIIALIITFVSSRFKHKNIATTIVGAIFFLLIMVVSLNVQNYINEFIINSDSIVNGISKIYPPGLYLKDALINYDLISLLKFVLISLIPFIIFVFVFSKSFKVINGKMSESYKRANYKVKSLDTNSPIKAIVSQELRKYFAIPIYVLNTAIGMVILVAGAIATLFIDKATITQFLGYPGMENMMPMMILLFLVFTVGMSCTTHCSISLEGNRLWILKSLPIDVKDIFKGKIIMNLIITIPLTILANIIFFIGLKFGIENLIFNILISVLFAIVSAIVGIVININFPKMNWTNPTVVVKQSASVLISLAFTMLIIVIGVGMVIIAEKVFTIINPIAILIILTLLLLIILVISIGMLSKIGYKKFNSL